MRINILIYILFFFSASVVFSQDEEKLPYTVDDVDSAKFLFEYNLYYVGRDTRVNANYRYVLEILVETLQKNPEWTIFVRGHVCCGPSIPISSKRAKDVVRYLIESGIDKERITHKGYSDSMPYRYPEKTDEDKRLNRRVDFVITK